MSEKDINRTTVKRKGILETVFDNLKIKEDAESIEDYIKGEITNWLTDNIRKAASSISTNISNSVASGTIKLVNRLLYEDDRGSQPTQVTDGQKITKIDSSIVKRNPSADTPYNNMSARRSSASYASPSYQDLLFRSVYDAQEALEKLRDTIARYGGVPVSELYSIFNEKYGTNHRVPWSYQESGWANLDNAYPDNYDGMHYLVLPRPVRIR